MVFFINSVDVVFKWKYKLGKWIPVDFTAESKLQSPQSVELNGDQPVLSPARKTQLLWIFPARWSEVTDTETPITAENSGFSGAFLSFDG